MSHGNVFLASLKSLTLTPSDEQVIETRWREALDKAETAGRPVPHDDPEDVDAVAYIRNWRAAKVCSDRNRRRSEAYCALLAWGRGNCSCSEQGGRRSIQGTGGSCQRLQRSLRILQRACGLGKTPPRLDTPSCHCSSP